MPTGSPADRLKQARIAAGYKTPKAFYDAHNIPQPTYTTHEKGTRQLKPEIAADYADRLGCSAAWLLTGEGAEPADQTQGIIPATILIREADVRATAGHGGSDDLGWSEDENAHWQVPRDFVKAQTTAMAAALRVIRIYGDSMAPTFNPGERVLVDTSDTRPSPPGTFVLWGGLGIVVKRLEFVPYSEPPTVRLMSSNTSYQTYERALQDIRISGRVIAKWLWT